MKFKKIGTGTILETKNPGVADMLRRNKEYEELDVAVKGDETNELAKLLAAVPKMNKPNMLSLAAQRGITIPEDAKTNAQIAEAIVKALGEAG